jgi:nitrate/nitrite-specific signal transduction histidine kinase
MTAPPTSEQDEALKQTLERMVETSELLAGATDLNEVLRRLAQRTRDVAAADYAAIGTFDDDGAIERFVHVGIDEGVARRLGSVPVGRGLLGALARAERPIRLADLTRDPRYTGWPEGHPAMGPFLGVPIRLASRNIGSLYMARDAGGPPFTDADELAAMFLALQATVGVSAALARERSGRVLLLEERVRIAHDLHDGTIQSLYALGLEFEAAASQPGIADDVRTTFNRATAQLNHLIADIRNYISMLGAPAAWQPELSRDLAASVRQIIPDGVDAIISISAPALQELTARESEDLLYIAREALSNAARHSGATKVAIDLRQSDEETALTIQDNGIGFNTTAVRTGLGTVTIRTRAERLGGSASVLSIPGMGTTVRITIPRQPDE